MTFIEKVILFKDLYSKHQTDGLDTSEEITYNELFQLLKYEKFKDIENYRLDLTIDTSTEIEPIFPEIIDEEPIEEIKDIFDEMVQTLKQIHQKYINEGELDVDDVLLFDSIYPQLKKEGYYVEKYKIR
jgi:phage terminase small subunit